MPGTRTRDRSAWHLYVVDTDRTAHEIGTREQLDRFLDDYGITWQDLSDRPAASLFDGADGHRALEQTLDFKLSSI